jgi:hypothetical protein
MKQVGYKEAIQTEWLKFIQLEKVVEVIALNMMYKLICGWPHQVAWSPVEVEVMLSF